MESSSDINYSEYLQLIIPFEKSNNKNEKKIAYNFIILLTTVINDKKIESLIYLHEGIKNIIKYFMSELLELVDNKYNNIKVLNVHLELLNDCAKLISQEMIYHSKNPKILEFLMSFSLY
jgi:hypothetical protein